jgi:transposase
MGIVNEKISRHTSESAHAFTAESNEFIDEKHMVRIVSALIDRIASSSLEDIFAGGGTPSYHRRMMLKVILYAYIRQIYSCRKIAKALREDLSFMWPSGLSHPDFNTVNRFRSDYFREILEDIYSELLLFLESEGYIDLEDYFVDGRKFEEDDRRAECAHLLRRTTRLNALAARGCHRGYPPI